MGRGAIIRAGIGGAVIGGTATAVNSMATAPELPQFPGTTLNETPIIPCFEPGVGLGGVGDILPPVLSTPLDGSSFPIFSGTPLNPGIEWPNFLEAKKGGTPKRNVDQNQQFDGAVREIERRIGRRLSYDERRELHDEIHGQNYGYHEIVEVGVGLFGYR